MDAEIAGLQTELPAGVAQGFAQSIESPNRPSLIERMDTSWTDFFGAIGLPHFGFIDGGAAWLQVLEATTGLGWGGSLFLFGAGVRLLTLGLSVYGERATLRMAIATKEVKKEHDAYDEVYRSHDSTQLEIARAAETMKAARDASFAKHGTSMMAVLTPLAGAPVFCGGFAVVLRVLNDAPRSLVGASFGPASSLVVPDPSGFLAIAAVGATLVNFELTLARKRAGATNKHGIMAFAPIIARVAALAVVPVVMQFKAGTVIYWCGLSCAGLLQPLVMASPLFRKWFRVPDLGPQVQPNPFTVADMFHDDKRPNSTVPTDGFLATRFPRLARMLTPGAMLDTTDAWENGRDNARKANPEPATGGPKGWRKPEMDKRGSIKKTGATKDR
jgi:membrane protein insertase Oxa1/YidC/SpoIIIJ